MLQTFAEWTDGITLIPSDRGAFEVTVNGQQIYSKWESNQFPEIDELKGSIQKLLD